jgi:hypothetical protein
MQTLIFSPKFNFLKLFSNHEEFGEISLKTYTRLHVNYLLFLSDLKPKLIWSTDFGKIPNVEFQENTEPLLFGLRLTVPLTDMQFLSTFSARAEL